MYLLLWYNRMVGNLIRYIDTEPSISFTQNIFNTRTVTMKRNRDSSLVNYLCTQTFIPHRFVLSKLRRFLRQRWEKTDEDSPVTLTCSPWISARWAFSASSSRLLSASSFWMNSTSLKVQEANGRAPGSCVLTSENRNSFFFSFYTNYAFRATSNTARHYTITHNKRGAPLEGKNGVFLPLRLLCRCSDNSAPLLCSAFFHHRRARRVLFHQFASIWPAGAEPIRVHQGGSEQ